MLNFGELNYEGINVRDFTKEEMIKLDSWSTLEGEEE